jgi:hypothetical protein
VACCFVSFSFLIAGYLFRVMAPLCHSLGCLRLPLVLYLARSWHGVQLLQGQHVRLLVGVAMAL